MRRSETTILFRDDHLVAVVKPSGLLVHRTPEARDRVFLLQRVRDLVGRHVFPVHRIDRAASGVVLFAFSREMAADLQRVLGDDQTIKEYLVLCRGSTPLGWGCGRPLTDEAGRRKPSRTEFRRLESFAPATLVAARILTGRRHQIRRHLNHCGHHVVGDTRFGKGHVNRMFRERYGLHRLFLHATRLSIVHPGTGERLGFSSPLTDELAWVLDRLRSEEEQARRGGGEDDDQ